MTVFYENLAHFTHGMATATFLLVAMFIRVYGYRNRLSKLLFWVMAFWVFIQLKDLDYLVPGIWGNEYISNIQLSVDNWCVPITILLFFEIVSPKWVTPMKAVVLVAPSVALTMFYVLFPSRGVFLAGVSYSVLLGLVALIAVYIVSTRYDNIIKRNFLYLENISLRWMRMVVILLFLLLLVWAVESSFPSWLNDALYYLFSISVWVVILYCTIKHKVVEIPSRINPLCHTGKKEDGHTGEEDKFRFGAKLKRAMFEERLYLDPKLSLVALARRAGTNRSYLSEYINGTLGLTFYEYINSFRIAEAKKILAEDEEQRLTLEQIAEKCGFYSLSTFKRSFNKETGLTPGKYRSAKSSF